MIEKIDIAVYVLTALTQIGAATLLVKYYVKNQDNRLKKIEDAIEDLARKEQQQSDVFANIDKNIALIKQDFEAHKHRTSQLNADVIRIEAAQKKLELLFEKQKGEFYTFQEKVLAKIG